MGRHTAYDDLGSAERVDMISDMLSGLNIMDLTVLNGVIDSEIETRRTEVLKMRKRNHYRRIRRYKKRARLVQESESVSEDSENSDDICVSGIDDLSDDQDYENEEYVAGVMKKETTGM